MLLLLLLQVPLLVLVLLLLLVLLQLVHLQLVHLQLLQLVQPLELARRHRVMWPDHVLNGSLVRGNGPTAWCEGRAWPVLQGQNRQSCLPHCKVVGACRHLCCH